jgi:hypothetical protein
LPVLAGSLAPLVCDAKQAILAARGGSQCVAHNQLTIGIARLPEKLLELGSREVKMPQGTSAGRPIT